MDLLSIKQIVSSEFIKNNQKMKDRKSYLDSVPREDDINELQGIIKDFQIKSKIPKFSSIRELEVWKKHQIIIKLNEGEY